MIDATLGERSNSIALNGHSVYQSCAVTHENNFYIYGGDSDERQVLQVDNCGLTLIGSLSFDHDKGACGSSNGVIVLCFDVSDTKQCRKSTSPLGEWSEMTSSTYEHRWISIALSPGKLISPFYKLSFEFQDEFLAVGSYSPNSFKAELYSFGSDVWTEVSDYPFGVRCVSFYDMVYIPELPAYIVIGGYDGRNRISNIGKFQNGAWSDVGQLNKARSVSFRSFFYILKLLRQFGLNG